MNKGAVSNIENSHCEAVFAEACLALLCKAGARDDKIQFKTAPFVFKKQFSNRRNKFY